MRNCLRLCCRARNVRRVGGIGHLDFWSLMVTSPLQEGGGGRVVKKRTSDPLLSRGAPVRHLADDRLSRFRSRF